MTDPARLPAGAPDSLRKFVRCETDTTSIDLSDLGWIPRPRQVPDALEPSVTVGDGATATTATIKIGYGPFIALELPASIVDGELRVDTDQLGFGIGPNVAKWVAAFNDTLRGNGKRLDEFSVDGTTISLTKRPAAAVSSDGSTIAPTASATTAGTGTATGTAPSPGSDPERSSGSGCLAWIGGALAAVAVAVGIGVVATNSGDDSGTASTPDSVEIITNDTPATDPPAAPATDAPAPTTTTRPTTTVAEVATLTVGDIDGALAECALLISLDRPRLPTLISYGELETPTGPCAPGDTAPPPCDPELFPCSIGQAPPLGIVGDGTGIDHSIGFGDGASTFEELFFFTVYGTTTNPFAAVTTTCGGRPSTAEHPIQDAAVTLLPGPLYSYGPCDASTVIVDADGDRYFFPAVAPFVVGDPEPDPIPPGIDALTATRPDVTLDRSWTDDVNTINNTLGGRPTLDETCTWFLDAAAVEHVVRVLDQCQSSDTGHFWVFAAATTDVEIEVSDSIVATTASYVNPLGRAAPPSSDLEAFRTSGPLFDESLFPCGFGFHAYTVCAEGDPDLDVGGFVTVSASFVDDIPIEADGTSRAHTVDLSPSGGARYTITQEADTWSLGSSNGATRARTLIRGNAMTLVIPSDELPDGAVSYRWSSEIDGVRLDQPEIPVVGLVTTPTIEAEPTTTTEPPATEPTATEPPTPPEPAGPATTETLSDFFAQLSASLAAGDLGFALDRLDPRVLEVYPDSCPSAIASFADPDLVLELVDDADAPTADPWTYEAAGRSIEIPDAITVTLRLSGRGQTGEPTESHVSIVDGIYRWFTFC